MCACGCARWCLHGQRVLCGICQVSRSLTEREGSGCAAWYTHAQVRTHHSLPVHTQQRINTPAGCACVFQLCRTQCAGRPCPLQAPCWCGGCLWASTPATSTTPPAGARKNSTAIVNQRTTVNSLSLCEAVSGHAVLFGALVRTPSQRGCRWRPCGSVFQSASPLPACTFHNGLQSCQSLRTALLCVMRWRLSCCVLRVCYPAPSTPMLEAAAH